MKTVIRLLLGVLLVVAPALAQAETCTFAAGASRWTAVGTISGAGVTGCTASADDTFEFASGSDVAIDGDITITTGSVVIAAGSLRQSCGTTFKPGASLTISGGTFQPQGCVKWLGPVSSISWGDFATGATLTLPQDVSSIASASTDFVVYLDDNPTGGNITDPIQTASGPRLPGQFRPSYNRLAWYDISGVSTNTVTYDYDTWAASGGSGAVYAGTRGPIAPAAITVSAITRGPYGFVSDVAVPTGTLALSNDGGAQYVEVTTGTCAGKMAKILYSTDGGGGADTLHVAGDLSGCGTPDAKIHYGARAGDRIAIVTPAVIDGDVSGTRTTVVRWNGGSLKASFSVWNRLGSQTLSAVSPSLGMANNFAIYQQSATVQPSADSYLVDSMFQHGSMSSTSDTATIIWSSYTGTSARYSDTILDMNGVRFERLYLHDAAATAATAGVHGFIIEGVRGLVIDGARIERLSDDAVFAQNNNYTSTDKNSSFSLSDFLVYENFTNTASSQQGLEVIVTDTGTETTHQLYKTRGTVHVRDYVSTGINDTAFVVNVSGASINRVVIGGSGYSTTSGQNMVGNLQSQYATTPTLIGETDPSVLSNAFLAAYGTSTSVARSILAATVTGSIIFHPQTGGSIYSVAKAAGSFFYANTPGAGAEYATLDYGSARTQRATLDYGDSVWVQPGGLYICGNFGNQAKLIRVSVTRTIWALGNIPSGTASTNCWGTAKAEDNAVTVNGAILTSTAPATARGLGADASSGNGARYSDVCMATTYQRTASTACGTSASASCLTFSNLYPQANTGGTIRGFVSRQIPTDPCDAGRPTGLGWRQLGVSHAALGDFVLQNLGDFSTWSLGTGQNPKPITGY